jgi:hypothetical protein
MMPRRILFVGHGRHGKDTACETLAAATGWKNAGTLSYYLAPYVAAKLGLSVADCYARRQEHRDEWRRLGDEYRKDDPARLVKDAFAAGDVTGGCRARIEIDAVRDQSLADLIVWVDARFRHPADPTLEFGPEVADLIIDNNGTEAEFRRRVQRLGAVLL